MNLELVIRSTTVRWCPGFDAPIMESPQSLVRINSVCAPKYRFAGKTLKLSQRLPWLRDRKYRLIYLVSLTSV